MEKQSLPKLEIEGFTIYPSGRGSYRPENDASGAAGKASWRDRASRMVGRKGRAAGKASGDDVDPAYRKLLIKTGICAAIAIALLVISTVETPGSGGVRPVPGAGRGNRHDARRLDRTARAAVAAGEWHVSDRERRTLRRAPALGL